MKDKAFSELNVFLETDDDSEITKRQVAELQQFLRNEWEPTGEMTFRAWE